MLGAGNACLGVRTIAHWQSGNGMLNFWRFDQSDAALGRLLEGSYDPLLVLLSVGLACFAGITALLLADRIIASGRTPSRFWWLVGAVPMGCGIWAMHFTGMLAFRVEGASGMTYAPGLTFISLMPAVVGSAAALYFIAHSDSGGRRLQWCALLLAGGIGTMHYTGMEAMRMPGLRYDFPLFVLSLVVAHLLALMALRVRFGMRRLLPLTPYTTSIVAGLVFGFAVAGMHYTAMSASSFYEMPQSATAATLLSDTTLATAVGGLAMLILAMSMLASWMNRRMESRRRIELERLAHTDSLTGLPNRLPFQLRLTQALSEADAKGSQIAVLFLDLDDFKTINDSLGHAIGDRVLQICASRLRDSLRADDAVARFGGDEFVFLVHHINSVEDAEGSAKRLLQRLDAPIRLDDRKLHVSGSIGLSFYPQDGETAEDLIQAADTAMYQAKRERLRYFLFDRALSDQARERVRLISDLRDAMHNDQLHFYYQPWVEFPSRRWAGLEALARWMHPTEGAISPDTFIPLAERHGLLLQFEEWALRRTCRQARDWLDMRFDFGRISVNVSAHQFARWDFVDELRGVLYETGLPGTRLELEITESSLMVDHPTVLQRLERIRELGVTFAVDDFGTGYSSLNYLKTLPLDKLKIDATFAKGIPQDSKDMAIVRAVVEMGTSLGFSVVVEGIEREEQYEGLLVLGCSYGQGCLFSRPLPSGSVEAANASVQPLVCD
ncbi:MAG: EAL domain-containing protein [Halofilum sp. (in: g-proteobacteria)]